MGEARKPTAKPFQMMASRGTRVASRMRRRRRVGKRCNGNDARALHLKPPRPPRYAREGTTELPAVRSGDQRIVQQDEAGLLDLA